MISNAKFLIFVFISILTLSPFASFADNDKKIQNMLDSSVFIQCNLEYKGKTVTGGSGTGFLVSNSEYVITNDHVIDSCLEENKNIAIKSYLAKMYFDDFKKSNWPKPFEDYLEKYIRKNPQAADRLKKDKDYFIDIVSNWVNDYASKGANSLYTSFKQKLYVMIQGKEGKQAIKIDVASVPWASSEKIHKDAKDIGTDIAILKLSRRLSNRPSVTFATGNSAKVNDVIYAVGFPGASIQVVPSVKYTPTFKDGTISKLGGTSPSITKSAREKGQGVPVIEINAAISRGNSGGPLFNEYGEVLGVNTFIASNASGYGWAQDISVVIPIMNDLGLPLPEIRTTPRTWMDNNKTFVITAGAVGGMLTLTLLGLLFFRIRGGKKTEGVSIGLQGTSKPPGGKGAKITPSIVGRAGEFSAVSIPVPPTGLLLGREIQGAGKLDFKDKSVSREQHCLIQYNDVAGQFIVTDLGSMNGTFIFPDNIKLQPQKKTSCATGKIVRLGNNNKFELVVQ